MLLQALDLALENLDKIFAQAGEKEKEKESVEGVLNVVCWLFQRVLENNTNQVLYFAALAPCHAHL